MPKLVLVLLDKVKRDFLILDTKEVSYDGNVPQFSAAVKLLLDNAKVKLKQLALFDVCFHLLNGSTFVEADGSHWFKVESL